MRAFAVVGVLAVLGTACGGSSSGGTGGSSGGTTQGVTSQEIKVGAFYPATGGSAAYADITAGASAYFDMVNTAGGVGGRKINYVTRDDQYDPSKTVSVARRLVESDKVFAIVGGVGSPSNAAVLDYMTKVGIPNVAPLAGGDVFAKEFRTNYFPIVPPYSASAKILATYAVDQLKVQTVSVFYENDDVGQPAVGAIDGVLKASGRQSPTAVGYPSSEVDFSSYAQKLKSAGADAVIAFAGTPGVTGVQKAAKAIGYTPVWLAPSFAASGSFFKLGGADGTYTDNFLVPLSDNSSQSDMFKKQMQAVAPQVQIGTLPEEGWVAASIFVEGVKRAEAKGGLTWQSFIAGLETMQNYDAGLAKGVTYTTQARPGVTQETILQGKGGTFVPVSGLISVPK